MSPPSVETVERRLLALDAAAFRSFVAALYRESGWAVEEAGAVLELRREGETRRLLVLPPRRILPGLRSVPAHDGPVDGVVSPYADRGGRSLPRSLPDVPVEGAEALRDRAAYAVDASTRDRLFQDHLGIDPAAPDDAVGLRPLPPLRRPRSGGAAAGAVGVALVLAGLFVLLAASGAFGPDGGSGTANASEPTTAGTTITASASGYDASPTCERGPREIVEVTTAALRGPEPGRGIATLGRFWNARLIQGRPAGSWAEDMRSPDRAAFYNATEVRITDVSVEGDEATVRLGATIDGEDRPYVFGFGRGETFAGSNCWVIEYFGPVVGTT